MSIFNGKTAWLRPVSNPGDKPDRAEQSEHGWTSVTEEWQSDADNRSDADTHSDIDKRLERNRGCNAKAKERIERSAGTKSHDDTPDDDSSQKHQYNHTGDQSQLLADNRKDKVRMLAFCAQSTQLQNAYGAFWGCSKLEGIEENVFLQNKALTNVPV